MKAINSRPISFQKHHHGSPCSLVSIGIIDDVSVSDLKQNNIPTKSDI